MPIRPFTEVPAGTDAKVQKLGIGGLMLQRAILDQLTIARREAIEKKIDQAKQEETQRLQQQGFGGTKPRFL